MLFSYLFNFVTLCLIFYVEKIILTNQKQKIDLGVRVKKFKKL